MPKYILKHSRFMQGQFDKASGVFFITDLGHADPQYVSASADFPVTIDVPKGHKVDEAMFPTDQATLDEKLAWRKKHAERKAASDANPWKGPAPDAPKKDEIYTEAKDKLHFVEKSGHIMSSVQVHGKTEEKPAKGSGKNRASDEEPI